MNKISKKEERLGEVRKNRETLGGYEMKIIEYKNAHNVIVEFQDEYKAKIHTQYKHFKNGGVKNPYHPEVFDVGYLGQGKYEVKGKDGKKTKAYNYWMNMLNRCYNPYELNRDKGLSYINCYVCEEWLCFQNFAKWFYKHYYECNGEKMHLDKDILFKGNKIYSPENCILVPERINKLFIKRNTKRGEYPIGVSRFIDKRRNWEQLRADCNTLEKTEFLGYFPINKPFQAFTAYKNFKENYIKKVADEYKDLIPTKLYKALYKYEVEIND